MSTKREIQKKRREMAAEKSSVAVEPPAEFVTLSPAQRSEIDGLIAAGQQLDAIAQSIRAAAELHRATAAAFWARTFAALGVDPKRTGEYVAQLGAVKMNAPKTD